MTEKPEIGFSQNRVTIRAGKGRGAHRGLSKSPGKKCFGSMIAESAYLTRGQPSRAGDHRGRVLCHFAKLARLLAKYSTKATY
jgi:hypothetical protein